MNEFIKYCPKCGRKQIYGCKSSLNNAIRKNKICVKCQFDKLRVPVPIEGWIRLCSKCGKEMIYSCRKSYLSGKKSNSICGKCATKESAKYVDRSLWKTQEYRQKMSDSIKLARKTDSYGEKFKEKCRINRAKQISNGIVNHPQYNKNACKFIDNVNNKFGWMLVHAENGGEKVVDGFFVDGYDEIRNIIFEYDEPKHNTLWQKKRDHIKEKVVINKINPTKFIRYNEKDKTLYDIINKEVICL